MHAKLFTVVLGGCQVVHAAVAQPRLNQRDGGTPSLPHDDKTTSFCTWWIDYTEAKSCRDILEDQQISITQFKRWVSYALNLCFLIYHV